MTAAVAEFVMPEYCSRASRKFATIWIPDYYLGHYEGGPHFRHSRMLLAGDSVDFDLKDGFCNKDISIREFILNNKWYFLDRSLRFQ